MSVFNLNASKNLEAKMFLDENGGVDIARYDQVKYPEIDRITVSQVGFFWRPEEIDLNVDRGDFKKLADHEKHIFTSNLKRQILLDSVQGRAPAQIFGPLCGLPEVENFLQAWTFFETIHSRSYTHIIRQVFPNPGEIFDGMKEIEEIVDCAKDISKYYDELERASLVYRLYGPGKHMVNGEMIDATEYGLKKKLWLCLMSVNVLEGLRFYVSFACSWAFAENKKMEGNAKIIKFIARDENLHLSFTQKLIKVILFKDDPIYKEIAEETRELSTDLFRQCAQQEKAWAKYLFRDGSIIGLNEALLGEYVDYLTALRMRAVGLDPLPKGGSNPLPWTNAWIGSGSRQPAPQEVEIDSYIIGGIKRDTKADDFGGFQL